MHRSSCTYQETTVDPTRSRADESAVRVCRLMRCRRVRSVANRWRKPLEKIIWKTYRDEHTDLLKNNNIGFEFWKEDLVGDSQRHSEIGDHLLALWVSEICVKKYPQDRTTNQNKKPSVLLGVSNIIHTLLSLGHSFCRSIGRPCGYYRHICPCNTGKPFGCRESQC